MKKVIAMAVVDLICIAAIAWAVCATYAASEEWFYSHLWLLGMVLVVATLVMWCSGYIVLRPHLLLPLAVTVIATTAQAGIFTPASADSANSGKNGSYWSWLFHGWSFGWDFWRDGLDSWQSGHPVITIDPQPPASDDASGK